MFNQNSAEIIKWAECQEEVIWIDGIPWRIRNKMLLPLSMPHTLKNVDRLKVREALKKTDALLAHWSSEWDLPAGRQGGSESEWWWTCCDSKNYSIENIKSNNARRGIQKGIELCRVKKIKPKEFLSIGYKVYFNALRSYGGVKISSEEEYNNEISAQCEYEGFEIWGAFIENKLAAFATCIFVDNAVSLGSTKSDPEFHKFYPNNALFYEVTKHYLRERNVLYVTNGFRTLLHPTSINDFLIRMGYRKIYCRLNLELSVPAKLIINSRLDLWYKYLKIFNKIVPHQLAKIKALLKINEISKSFN